MLALHDFATSAGDSVEILARRRSSGGSAPIWLIIIAVAGGLGWRFRAKIAELFKQNK